MPEDVRNLLLILSSQVAGSSEAMDNVLDMLATLEHMEAILNHRTILLEFYAVYFKGCKLLERTDAF